MATGNAQFRTAAEWGHTGAFTFSTTNSSLNSYVTSTSQIPTKATLKGALNTGYTMTITNDSTYLSNQLVPNSAISYKKNVGQLQVTLLNCYTSAMYELICTGSHRFTGGMANDMFNHMDIYGTGATTDNSFTYTVVSVDGRGTGIFKFKPRHEGAIWKPGYYYTTEANMSTWWEIYLDDIECTILNAGNDKTYNYNVSGTLFY
jgi:hypothetical protein